MWNLAKHFKSPDKSWRDQLIASAPEANPHQFIRRHLFAKTASQTDRPRQSNANTEQLASRL
jgi:hypothetical protein